MKRKEKMEMTRERTRQNAYPEILIFQQQVTCRICETDAHGKITGSLPNSRQISICFFQDINFIEQK
jgi:hypothetical protein